MKKEITDIGLRLSGQRALWGHVPPTLRSASIEFKNGKLKYLCIFDGEPTDDDKKLLSMAASEIIADFPDDFKEFEEKYIGIKFPGKMKPLKNLLYLRHEHNYYRN